jgi:hypothetical protein
MQDDAGTIALEAGPANGEMGDRHKVGHRGYTVADYAARLRVSPCKIRSWIRAGVLKAINTSAMLCGKPRWVILPHQANDFEQLRSSAPPPKPARRRRRRVAIDFYPDGPDGK